MGDSNDELQPGPTEFFGMVGRMRPPERYDKIQNILLFVGLGADVAQHGFFQIWAGGLCHGLAAPPSAGGRRCYPLPWCKGSYAEDLIDAPSRRLCGCNFAS